MTEVSEDISVYEDISVSFDNSEPTALFKKHATAAESILPFEDDKALFLEAIALTATIFPQIEDGANKKAIWNDVFTAALNNTGHEALADDAVGQDVIFRDRQLRVLFGQPEKLDGLVGVCGVVSHVWSPVFGSKDTT